MTAGAAAVNRCTLQFMEKMLIQSGTLQFLCERVNASPNAFFFFKQNKIRNKKIILFQNFLVVPAPPFISNVKCKKQNKTKKHGS